MYMIVNCDVVVGFVLGIFQGIWGLRLRSLLSYNKVGIGERSRGSLSILSRVYSGCLCVGTWKDCFLKDEA